MKWEHRIEKMRNELRARAYRFFGFLQVCHGMTYSINYTVSISWDTLTRDVSRVGRKFVKVFRACIQNYIIFRATIRFSFVVPTAVTSVSEVTDFSSAKSEITSASGFLSSARISLTHFLNQHAMELRREDQSLTRFLTCFKKRFR